MATKPIIHSLPAQEAAYYRYLFDNFADERQHGLIGGAAAADLLAKSKVERSGLRWKVLS